MRRLWLWLCNVSATHHLLLLDWKKNGIQEYFSIALCLNFDFFSIGGGNIGLGHARHGQFCTFHFLASSKLQFVTLYQLATALTLLRAGFTKTDPHPKGVKCPWQDVPLTIFVFVLCAGCHQVWSLIQFYNVSLLKVKDLCEKSVLFANSQSRYVSGVLDRVISSLHASHLTKFPFL